MAIQYVGGLVGNRAGATTAFTVSLNFALTGGIATSPAVGDFVVVTCVVGTTARNPAQAVTNPVGFTALTQLNSAAATFDTSLCVSYKFLVSESSVDIPSTGNVADGQSYTIQVFRGVDTTTPLDVTPTSAIGTGTTRADPPSITPVTPGTFVVICAGGSATTASALTYSGLTAVLSQPAADTNDAVVGSGYVAWGGSGAVDIAASTTGSAVAGADSWAAYAIALRAAGAAVTPGPNTLFFGNLF